jgi:DnaJ-class molecular chaperone
MAKQHPRVIEINCPACEGKGHPVVKQSAGQGRRIYAPRCAACGGKGRIVKQSGDANGGA